MPDMMVCMLDDAIRHKGRDFIHTADLDAIVAAAKPKWPDFAQMSSRVQQSTLFLLRRKMLGWTNAR